MYERYWKLRGKPFENDLDTGFIFYGAEMKEGLVRALYSVSSGKSLMLLTGEAGCGKTFLCQALARELASKSHLVAMVVNPADDPLELLRQIAHQLGISPVPRARTEILAEIHDALADASSSGARAVVIVDNAETIENDRVLEEVRLLLDLESDGRTLATVVLVGQPRLRHSLRRVPSLLARVNVQFHIPALGLDEACAYISHRLSQVNGNGRIFAERALHEVYRASRGVPRMINNICDLALLLGMSGRRGQVDQATVSEAKEEFRELGVN